MLGDALVSGIVAQDVGKGQTEAILDFGDLVLAITVECAPEGRTAAVDAMVGSVSASNNCRRYLNVRLFQKIGISTTLSRYAK